MYHSIHRQNIVIALLGLIFGIVSAGSLFFLKSTKVDIARTESLRKIISAPTPIPPSPTPTDFCVSVPVLFYHHIQPLDKAEEKGQKALSVSPGSFEAHIKYLLNKDYTFITTSDLINALRVRKNLGKVVVIQLDDGYRDNYEYAFPIAKRQGVKVDVMMITGLAGHEEHLSWSHINTMRNSGLFNFYNHSWSHRALNGKDENMIERQIMNAQNQLETNSSNSARIMIYPYGKFDETAKKILAENNFDAAFGVKKGTQHCLSNIYELPRLRTGNFHLSVHGL